MTGNKSVIIYSAIGYLLTACQNIKEYSYGCPVFFNDDFITWLNTTSLALCAQEYRRQ